MTDADLAIIAAHHQTLMAAPWVVPPILAHLMQQVGDDMVALMAEVRRLTALTMAIELLQAENVALRAEVAKMAPLWHLHQTPPDGVTYTVHQSISSQEQP